MTRTAPAQTKEELMMMTVAEIISQLIKAHEQGEDINLNKYNFFIILLSHSFHWHFVVKINDRLSCRESLLQFN